MPRFEVSVGEVGSTFATVQLWTRVKRDTDGSMLFQVFGRKKEGVDVQLGSTIRSLRTDRDVEDYTTNVPFLLSQGFDGVTGTDDGYYLDTAKCMRQWSADEFLQGKWSLVSVTLKESANSVKEIEGECPTQRQLFYGNDEVTIDVEADHRFVLLFESLHSDEDTVTQK